MGVLTGFRRPKLNFLYRLQSAVSRDLFTHCSHFNKIWLAEQDPFFFFFSFFSCRQPDLKFPNSLIDRFEAWLTRSLSRLDPDQIRSNRCIIRI